MSDRREALAIAVARAGARLLFRAPARIPQPWPVRRAWVELAATANRVPHGVRRSETRLEGVRAERLEPKAGGDGALLYLHGGAYVEGSPRVQRVAAARLAIAAGATAYSADYRLAPEHRFPAAFDDGLAAYRALAEREGAGNVVLAGDSAGAGLALAVALAGRDEGRSPAGLFLICPFVDLAADRSEGSDTDPILSRRYIRVGADAYLDGADPADVRCSPINGDLAGLPPILVHAAEEDPLRPDAEELERRARTAGVDIRLERFPLWHDFHLHAGVLQTADEALARGASFVRERLDATGQRSAKAASR
jgi:epsilon-lactone hydrolase